jgi:hypothetical protein
MHGRTTFIADTGVEIDPKAGSAAEGFSVAVDAYPDGGYGLVISGPTPDLGMMITLDDEGRDALVEALTHLKTNSSFAGL